MSSLTDRFTHTIKNSDYAYIYVDTTPAHKKERELTELAAALVAETKQYIGYLQAELRTDFQNQIGWLRQYQDSEKDIYRLIGYEDAANEVMRFLDQVLIEQAVSETNEEQ